MSDEKPDKAHDPIHFTEDYRLAKRNVLFWAIATILIAVGTASSGTTVEVTALVKELQFDQGFLTFSSLAVTAFMVVGYIRAERGLLARHSGFAFAYRMHQNADLAVEVGKELEAMKAALGYAQEDLSKAKVQLGEARTAVEQFTVTAGQVVNEIQSESVQGLRLPAPSKQSASTVIFAEKLAKEAIDAARDWAVAQVGKSRASLLQSFTVALRAFERPIERADGEQLDATRQIDDTIADYARLSSQLHGFADTIGTGEKQFFFWHDRAPVYGMTTLAAWLGMWRLINPSGLAGWMSHLFG